MIFVLRVIGDAQQRATHSALDLIAQSKRKRAPISTRFAR